MLTSIASARPVRVTKISTKHTAISVSNAAAAVARVTSINVGRAGKDGAAGVGSDWNTLANKPVQFVRQDFLNTNVIAFAHNMQRYPSVHVEDTGGNRWIPTRTHYPSINDIAITFDTAFSGTVFLS